MRRVETFVAWFVCPLLLVVLQGCSGAPANPDAPPSSDDDLESTIVDSDSDGDGFPDDEEINGIPGTDPFDPTDNPDNVRDTDGDGCSDFDESNFIGFCNNDPDVPSTGGDPEEGNVSIDGVLMIGASAAIDGDTNDPTNAVVDNNAEDLSKIQPLPNPSSLGGYLGVIGQAPDVSDAYRVQMAAGQTATLLLANPTVNDFDLWMYDESGNPLASSEGFGGTEQVTAPGNGTFLVEVFGYSVAMDFDPGGLYTLLVGENTFAAGATFDTRSHLSSLHEFVEGEVLVRYEEQAARIAPSLSDEGLEVEVLNVAANSGGIARLRVRVAPRGTEGQEAAATRPTANVLGRRSSDTIAAVKLLARRGDVAYAQPNYIRRAFATPNDEFFPLQWHYPLIGLPEAWEITTGDPTVTVAVIDTGVVMNHPDLQGQLVGGYDFISDLQMARDGDGIDPNADDPGDLAIQGTSSSFHGTHVAGTVAARTNNGTGVAGVAWGVRILPVRVLGQGGGTDFDIAQGIYYAGGLSNASGTVPPQKADVINLSLGGRGMSTVEQEAIDAARANGTIVIAASGNDSTNADFYSPAGLDGVLTVSAVGLTRKAAPYSNFGSSVDVAAPGGDVGSDANGDAWPDGVLSTIGTDGGGFEYAFLQGTSMAAPHVAGVVALMKSVNPELTPQDVDLLIAGTHPATTIRITDDLGSPGKDEVYGHGLINAVGALRAAGEIAGGSVLETPLIQVSPLVLDFGADLVSAQVTVRNAGAGTLNVASTVPDETWLTVTPVSGQDDVYNVRVSRAGLANGVYSAGIEIASNGGTASVSVRMRVGAPQAAGGDIGTVYTLLLRAGSFEVVAQYNATAGNGYSFSFQGVPPGQYVLFAGTDMNNDSFIDDPGEGQGAYPTLAGPQILEIFQDRSGLAFNVGFSLYLQAPANATVGGSTVAQRPRLQRIAKQPRR